MPPDLDKMNKLPAGARFFDVNDLWYFANRGAVRFLYAKPVTANQVTLLSLVFGLASAACYLFESGLYLAAAFLYGKIFLDNVDGNLARVRGEVSRVGRFLDSLTDFVVTVAVYLAITWRLHLDDPWILGLGLFALLSCLMQCSYFVYYLVSYAATVGAYRKNRVDERIQRADREGGKPEPGSLALQRLYGWVYGWQDRAMQAFDRASRGLAGADSKSWLEEKWFLSLISPLCLCTNNMLLVVCTLFDQLTGFLLLVAVAGNLYLIFLQALKVVLNRCRA